MDVNTLAMANAYTDRVTLTVLNITTEVHGSETGEPLNDADSALLDAAAEKGLPIVLRILGGLASCVCNFADMGADYYVFEGTSPSIPVTVFRNMGKWGIVLPENL